MGKIVVNLSERSERKKKSGTNERNKESEGKKIKQPKNYQQRGQS